MNYKLIGAVMRLPMKSPAKAVFLALSTYTDKADGSGAFPSIERLAFDVGYGTRTVERALTLLEKEGWIKSELYRKQRVKGWSICLDKMGLTPEQVEIKPRKKGEPPLPAQPDEATPADTTWQGPGMSAKERLEQKRIARQRAEQATGVLSL